MKLLFGIFALATLLVPGKDDGQSNSVLDTNSQPILVDNGPVVTTQETVLEKPIINQAELQAPFLNAPAVKPFTESGPIYPQPFVQQVAPIQICNACRCVTCCCKSKRRAESTLCLVDPSGCVHEAWVRVPECCLNEPPRVSWKGRLLGRQVATLCWDCCDFEAKVVVTRRGKVRVRD